MYESIDPKTSPIELLKQTMLAFSQSQRNLNNRPLPIARTLADDPADQPVVNGISKVDR